jgi:TIR domain
VSSVFVSYSSADISFVKKLVRDLEARNVQVWWDKSALLGGDSLLQKIALAIDKHKYLAVVLTPSAVKSAWVQKELALAMAGQLNTGAIKVVPLLVKNCEIPKFLADMAYIKMDTRATYALGLESLFRRILDKERTPPGENAGKYSYRASALGLGGRLTRPIQCAIPVQAATVLSAGGGAGSARVTNFSLRGPISFQSAYSNVVGGRGSDEISDLVITEASSVVEGLNVLNVLTADRVVSRLSLLYSATRGDCFISAAGSHFDNLRIAGKKVEAVLPHESVRPPENLRNIEEAVNAALYRKEVLQHMMGLNPSEPGRPELHFCSEVKGFSSPITVSRLGAVYLSELIISNGRSRLNMLRIGLKSANSGDVVIAGTQVGRVTS